MPYCRYRIIEERKKERRKAERKDIRHTAKWKLTFALTTTLVLSIIMGLAELNVAKCDVHSMLSAGQWLFTGWLAFVMIIFTRNMQGGDGYEKRNVNVHRRGCDTYLYNICCTIFHGATPQNARHNPKVATRTGVLCKLERRVRR